MVKKGANKDILDNKGRSPFQIAFDKRKNDVVRIFTENVRCQLCTIREPYHKVEKSRFNIIFFLILHFVAELFGFFIIVPCMILYLLKISFRQ